MGRKLRLTETELVNLIQKVISEQSTPPGPNGYPGGVPCYACILNHPVMRTFPQNAVTSNGECAPTGYGYQGTQYALPGGSASYSYPSIWSTSQPTNCGNTTPGDWWCDPTGAFVSATGSPCIQSPTQPQSYFTGPSTTEQICIASCGTGGGTASCNKTPGSCQHKRIQCKMGMVKERRIQLGCSN